VDGIVNIIRGLGEKIDEKFIVKKVLKSLSMRFNPKISTLEDRKYLEKLTIDEFHGILIAYEMRIGQEQIPKREATFKVSKKTNKRKERSSDNSYDDSDTKEANFVRRL
jgi:hypothetical protein